MKNKGIWGDPFRIALLASLISALGRWGRRSLPHGNPAFSPAFACTMRLGFERFLMVFSGGFSWWIFHGVFFVFFCGQSMSKLIEIGWIGVWGWSRMVNIEDKDGPEICVTTTHGGPEFVEVTLPRSPQLSAKLHHCFFLYVTCSCF